MDESEKKRTERQSRALHTYFTLVARELSNQGQTMQDVVEKMTVVQIWPTKHVVKEMIFRPIMYAMTGQISTKKITTKELQAIYETMAQFLSTNFGISLPFPSQEDLREKIKN